MIDKLELRKYAQIWQLSLEVVQKDYVLGWLTAAIGNHPKLKTD